ncbi:MAG: aspartate--tRNA ligase [Candidatus Marinimicrobia bacterium]|nr:aspartate--tRNA ligase [Candidatus Neomarinimicrobiota bacterium]
MRTHFCGELRKEDSGSDVTLMGWVAKRRDHGGLIFVDLRDRYGITQVVFNPQMPDDGFKIAEKLSAEDVIKITGTVGERPEGTLNPDLDTGEIEVNADTIELLSEAETPPFEIREEVEASEDLRLEYRYLDLRRRKLRDAIIMRHEFYQSVRNFMANKGFIEIETPVLTKSTPEGARDFLVPSRISKGKFFALPQSPQIYKQLLMISGFDKYFQIVKAFRDEDLRSDRQPEHTQVDIEMSFVEERHVQQMVEELMGAVFKELIDVELSLPFRSLTYEEALNKYGTDKPDLRFRLEISDVSKLAAETEFQVFGDAVDNGVMVACIAAPAVLASSSMSSKESAMPKL